MSIKSITHIPLVFYKRKKNEPYSVKWNGDCNDICQKVEPNQRNSTGYSNAKCEHRTLEQPQKTTNRPIDLAFTIVQT